MSVVDPALAWDVRFIYLLYMAPVPCRVTRVPLAREFSLARRGPWFVLARYSHASRGLHRSLLI